MLYRSHPECEQFYSVLSSQAIECNIVHKQNDAACNVKICTFNDLDNKLVQTDDFDLVIAFNPLRLQVYDVNISEHRKQHPTKFLGFFSNQETENNWFYNAPCIFSYSYTDVVRDGYDSVIPESDIEKSVYFQILLKIGFKQSFEQQEILGKYNIRPNIVLEKNGQYFLTDIKCYRGFEYSSDNLNHAVKQMLYYKSLTEKNGLTQFKAYVIIMMCIVNDSVINDIYAKYGITVWDIRNIVYLCQNYPEVKNKFEKIVPFPIAQIEPCPPLEIKENNSEYTEPIQFECDEDRLIFALKQCEYGKENKSDKKYETICTEIINHLFSSEFYKSQPQHSTSDDLFRMDLICSLKGTKEFWKFLMHYFHTKFVVFEYKNYKEPISQNLIYITEKYLYPAVLRNVAFIISRNGFHPHAEIAAMGCLKENGKLIVSLDDADLCKMLLIKKNGEEPSDYLLNKVESILMSVSK